MRRFLFLKFLFLINLSVKVGVVTERQRRAGGGAGTVGVASRTCASGLAVVMADDEYDDDEFDEYDDGTR